MSGDQNPAIGGGYHPAKPTALPKNAFFYETWVTPGKHLVFRIRQQVRCSHMSGKQSRRAALLPCEDRVQPGTAATTTRLRLQPMEVVPPVGTFAQGASGMRRTQQFRAGPLGGDRMNGNERCQDPGKCLYARHIN